MEATKARFDFFSLPTELRNDIYEQSLNCLASAASRQS